MKAHETAAAAAALLIGSLIEPGLNPAIGGSHTTESGADGAGRSADHDGTGTGRSLA